MAGVTVLFLRVNIVSQSLLGDLVENSLLCLYDEGEAVGSCDCFVPLNVVSVLYLLITSSILSL